ncbi:Pol polyprotein [Plakobranchus ocellatus]|uniref:Pol polyprotein n=1 Tax=Plakobranchus ocellatus TaxID=259542 RepID=A0AAV3YZ04_9GAST|nr:Pol polyprotein [Plakobranchus ocellatus]
MAYHFEFLRMPFGIIMISGATRTCAVKMLARGMNYFVDYVDDLLVHTPTLENQVRTLRELFKRLPQANLTVKPKKCLLGAKAIDFPGQRLGEGTIYLQDENVEKVRAAKRFKTKKKVRAFLGSVGYCKEFFFIFPNMQQCWHLYLIWCVKGKTNPLNWDHAQERVYLWH